MNRPYDHDPTPTGANTGPKQRPLRGAFILLLCLLVGGAAAIAVGVYLLSPPAPDTQTTTVFEVSPGWGASRVGRALESQGIIRNAQVFALYLRTRGDDRAIGEGLYDLSPAMSTPEVAAALQRGGRPLTVRVVIPEGWRAQDVARRLAATGLGDEGDFMTLIGDPGALRLPFMPEDATLEGYLFPAAYDVPPRSSPEQVLRLMLSRFTREVTPEITAVLAAETMTVHQWVILASMVQAEAGGASEMPIIAGVFRNRLTRNMRLQSDPTVAYGLGKRLNELDRFAGDFTPQADHPWNTYTRPDLPQGPISNPGREALRAVLAPERQNGDGQDFLYFLHSRDGRTFRPNLTLEEHERDVQRFLR